MTKRKNMVIKAVCLILLTAGLAGMIKTGLSYHKGDVDYAEAMELAKVPKLEAGNSEKGQGQGTQGGDMRESEETDPYMLSLAGIDLDALRENNSQVTGWIAIPDSQVSYPLVQGEDNSYYLNRTWKRERSSVGAIFLECQVNRDLSDFNTIIYGHKMRNGSMFGGLNNYSSREYWEAHPCIYIADGNGVYRYRIYAAYETGVREITYRLNITESEKKEEFIRFGIEHSLIDTGVKPGTEDKVVTLSTCTGNGYSTRWVVQAVRELQVTVHPLANHRAD